MFFNLKATLFSFLLLFTFDLKAEINKTKELQKLLLQIAKNAIDEELTNKKLIDRERILKKYPELSKDGAIFVTITKNENLRGCKGSIIPTRSLLDDLIKNAKSSAFKDSRFKPLREDEFNQIKLKISILTLPREVKYDSFDDLKRKIKPYIDGVIVILDNKMATFLPHVWEKFPTFEKFFYRLYLKAKIDTKYLNTNKPKIYIYQSKEFKEE